MNMPPPAPNEYFATAHAIDDVPQAAEHSASASLLRTSVHGEPLPGTMSVQEGEGRLSTLLQQHPELCIGVTVLFLLTLLGAALWTLVNAASDRRTQKSN